MFSTVCVSSNKEKGSYEVIGMNDSRVVMTADEIKAAIKARKLEVCNMRLTARDELVVDDRLASKEECEGEEVGITNFTMFWNKSRTSLRFKSNMEKDNFRLCILCAKALGLHVEKITRTQFPKGILASVCTGEESVFISTQQICINTFGAYTFRDSCFTNIDLNGVDISGLKAFGRMFQYCRNLESVDFGDTEGYLVTHFDETFSNCRQLKSVKFGKIDTYLASNMARMFESCERLTDIDLSSFVTSNVLTMERMFCGCRSIERLDLSNFDTSAVETMERMFCECSSLEYLDISSFDMSHIKTTKGMFDGVDHLKKLRISRDCYSLVKNDLAHLADLELEIV